MTEFDTWLADFGKERIFRMLELRRPGDWTPYELDKKFTDESRYIDNHFTYVMIKEAIELPDGDILLGLAYLGDPSDINLGSTTILYRKLSEIVLEYYPEDDEFAEIAN